MATKTDPVTADPALRGATGRSLRFGAFTLQPDEHRLLRGEDEVPIGPRAFDILCVLARRPGQLITKDELLALVWHGLVVEEANLHVQVSQLRKVIGTEAITTVPGVGYRFICPIVAEAGVPPAAAPTAPASHSTRRLSVIVLPFIENGVAPEQDYFADAITDDITTQLSKIKGSTVIGSQTALRFKRQALDVSALARELGVRYVLQGRIERTDDGVEVNARLSDAATNAVIWSDLISVGRNEVRHIRREVVARLANALNLELQYAEAQRIAARSGAPEALDLVMQARSAGGTRTWTADHYEHALGLCERALALDPANAEALSLHALMLVTSTFWPGPDVAQRIARAEEYALRALTLDSFDPAAWRALSQVRQQQFRLDLAFDAIEKSLELNPNDARALGWRGELLRLSGRSDLAFEPVQRALRLSPHDPHRWMWLCVLGSAAILVGEHARALPWLEQASALYPYWAAPLLRAAAYAALGQHELACAQQPGVVLESMQRRWNRVSNHPVFLRQVRAHIFGPLVACGALADYASFDVWAERQRRGAVDGA